MANSLNVCKGVWTRSCGSERSVIDYIIIREEDGQSVKKMSVDKETDNAPYWIRKVDGIAHKVYSDHNVIRKVDGISYHTRYILIIM